MEIDEAKVGVRKYNRGRVVPGHWVIGMIERGDQAKYRLKVIPDNRRDAATLLPIIQEYVAPRTTIMTDDWRAYHQLANIGEAYEHHIVVHAHNFIASGK